MVRKVIDSILPHAEFGRNDHRKDAPPFIRGYTLDSNAGPPITRTDSMISVFRMRSSASGQQPGGADYVISIEYNSELLNQVS